MRLYVASSWRNTIYPEVVKALREDGHDVYDFRNPKPGNAGFSWREVDPNWKNWTPFEFVEGLNHPAAVTGFTLDFDAMKWAEAGVLVLPSGRSAHLEAGYFIGKGKPLWILVPEKMEPELMYGMASGIYETIGSLRNAVIFEGKIPF